MRPESVGINKLRPKNLTAGGFIHQEEYATDTWIINNPDLGMTFEEEFKMYELIVRREHLMDRMFEVSLEFPNFLEKWRNCIESNNYEHILTNDYKKFMREKQEKLFNSPRDTNSISAALNMFDELKHVNQTVKIETLKSSLHSMQLSVR